MLTAGVARAAINPPLTLAHAGWGAQSHVYAQAIETDFRVTALVLSKGGLTSVLVELDLCRLLPEQVEDIRLHVAAAVGTETQNVSVAVTHTHAGPLTTRDYDRSGAIVRNMYMGYVREQAVSAALSAKKAKEPVTVGAGYGTCSIGKNRRQLLGDGRMVTGYNEGGDTDPTVSVVRFDRESGETIASIVQYACHPTTLGYTNRLLSPDYPGVTKRVVEQLVGGTCLFLQGAAGDIGPGPEGFKDDVAAMKRIGTVLGCEAAKILLQTKADATAFRFEGVIESGASLGMWEREANNAAAPVFQVRSAIVGLPLKEQMPVEEAERLHNEYKQELERLQAGFAADDAIQAAGFKAKRASLALERSRQFYGRSEADIEVHVQRIGEAVVVGVPLEPFSAIGKKIREASPFRYTLFGGYTNGWFGYLPTGGDYPDGGYEVETTPFSPSAAERLIERVIAIIQEMKAGDLRDEAAK
ncbi:neutral/alkaline non-lysosomal ceramidase N-terminal domain-containing protein [Paenibacillus allorhizosphaerae]|uniref:Neutral/alkaline non-lysosomal ceramidase N-terminal domain-containing protein n=1 Tax=Paenibacillus allorhizosphaerae TaxID=2849866 RepID=A0ABN7TSV8_9BACL|nr:neutral/alkaline non-lysosomal ceramidase N-terminal domain-containing protein [Paenibacillus allorhizosphaerae]CAG7654401.1 hypothetical protein PAECIP111802_05764 [Paenibacillus allorhizosphaerae]